MDKSSGQGQLANSAWSFVDPEVGVRFVEELSVALDNGSWDARFGYLRSLPTFSGSLRLIVKRAS
jgi:hypothetical protein